MELKKLKIFSPFIIFIIMTITHFGYEIMPNIITSFFFPVNESIYEHLKMIYSSIMIWSIIEYIIIKNKNIIVNNIFFNAFISGVINIIVFLSIYLPIRSMIGEIMIITFVILFISIIITQWISYYILKHKTLLNKYISIILIVLGFIFLNYFTYNPIKNYLFYDSEKEIYGIPNRD